MPAEKLATVSRAAVAAGGRSASVKTINKLSEGYEPTSDEKSVSVNLGSMYDNELVFLT